MDSCSASRRTIIIIFKSPMRQVTEKMELDCINILKGIACSEFTIDELRQRLSNSQKFSVEHVFNKIDVRGLKKIDPSDLATFLSVHRIAAGERECQYLISLNGNRNPYLTVQALQRIICANGDKRDQYQSSYRMPSGDVIAQNLSERETARIFEKQIEFYRSLENLREDFVRNYGYNYQQLFARIDSLGKGFIDEQSFSSFVRKYQSRVEFAREEYACLCKRLGRSASNQISYDDFCKALLPFEPSSYPIFRKESNFRDALNYVLREVDGLNIQTRYPDLNAQTLNKQPGRTGSSFRKNFDPYSNNPQSGTAQYFYDKDYLNELKQYKMTYFDPNKNFKQKKEETRGLQYHDDFFESYYRYLQERTRSQYFYNKFGKRYVYDNNMEEM